MTDAGAVARQLDAYNARDLDAFIACWAKDATIYALPDRLLARGRDAIVDRHRARFSEPFVHGELLSRTVVGNAVVDYERVTRTVAGEPAFVEVLAIYHLGADGLICSARFAEQPSG